MPRKGHIAKRQVLPDPIYNSVLVTRLVNSVMLDGKKGVAQQIIYGAQNALLAVLNRAHHSCFLCVCNCTSRSWRPTGVFLCHFLRESSALYPCRSPPLFDLLAKRL